MKRMIFGIVGWMGLMAFAGAKDENGALKEALSGFMQEVVDSGEIPGVVTLVGGKEGVMSLGAAGFADLEAKKPMRNDTIVWIASMSKPVTGTAVAMVAEEGLIDVNDPVAKYLPEFKDLKDGAGNEVTVTIAQCLSHTAGLQELTPKEELATTNLDQLSKTTAKKAVKFAPGTKWMYCQTSISVAARVVEVVSGESFPDFLEKRLFGPLGMEDTSFYMPEEKMDRLALAYEPGADGMMKTVTPYFLHGKSPTDATRYPRASGGLFSTAEDYGKFLRMVVRGGELDGRRYLKPGTIELMTRSHTAGLEKVGFVPGSAYGLGWIRVTEPQGVTGSLSEGSFGHGGAYGTQGWVDPVKGRFTILMIQRSKLGNGDASPVRGKFQAAAAK